MCGNCSEARKTASKVAAEFDKADSVREYYRKQGECRERERIIKLLKDDKICPCCCFNDDCRWREYKKEFIALIKGETNA